MKKASELIKELESGSLDKSLMSLYLDDSILTAQRNRYINAVSEFMNNYGDKEVEVYSAPGRSEIGGNHTDHQHGKVVTASINLDAIAVCAKTDDNIITFNSMGYGEQKVDISSLEIDPKEKETTASLIRGVSAGLKKRGFNVGGFTAFVTSDVLSGSGLSSSAAIEILLATIHSGLFNEDKVDPVTKAKIGQEAENQFFGKPSGLLDQMGCSVGGLVYIDFKDPKEPVVEPIDVDFDSFGVSLCVVDTKGSHADLTEDYALIPGELKKVAAFFGKEVLRDVDEDDFYANIPQIREVAGDRAVLRALHIYDDNKRVDEQRKALEAKDFKTFAALIKESGNSSYRYLQNVYSTKKPEEQSVSIALALTKKFMGYDCACRVQGGGFAGTIEVFLENDRVAEYKAKIEKIYGEGSCHVLKIRNVGGTKVM